MTVATASPPPPGEWTLAFTPAEEEEGVEDGIPDHRPKSLLPLRPNPLPLRTHEFKECFSLYDKKQRGKIKANDLIVVMRCLGVSPTPGEVDRHLLAHKIDRNAELDFSTFLTIMHQQMQQEDPKKEILLAMLMTDREKKGYITAAELRAKLTQMGEKLSNREVDDLLRETNVGPSGKIQYNQFIQMVTLPIPDY
uniref:Calmodulin-like protein 4 n=2 Tax=Ornithorhynchus anatinus TaxID=9258 RepID=A0A6I8PHU2_ORNAN